jgi:hypothetical protein
LAQVGQLSGWDGLMRATHGQADGSNRRCRGGSDYGNKQAGSAVGGPGAVQHSSIETEGRFAARNDQKEQSRDVGKGLDFGAAVSTSHKVRGAGFSLSFRQYPQCELSSRISCGGAVQIPHERAPCVRVSTGKHTVNWAPGI